MEFWQRALEGLAVNPDFWKDKTVLVTGHTGFKGSWLSMWLQRRGAKVVGYALAPPSQPSLFEVAKVSEGMTSISGDIRQLDTLTEAFQRHQPEIVFHLAAQSLIHRSYEQPVETYATNVLGTIHVLEAVRRCAGVRAVVCITSDKCYENKEWHWGYRENDTLGGRDPYSSSKASAELAIAAYRFSFLSHGEVAVASTRAGNVIGGGDWARDRLVPDVMRALQQRDSALIRNPASVRPWQHVLDPLHGYLLLAEALWHRGQTFAQSWNFGPNDDQVRPVSHLADHLIRLWGEQARWHVDPGSRPHEDVLLKLDCSKARSVLGWSPKLSLSTSLEWIVEWFKAFQGNDDMRRLSEQQIARHEGLEGMSR